jgi:hypothetical protein
MSKPLMVDGNARMRNPSVTRSSVELKDSTLETDEARRRRVDVDVDVDAMEVWTEAVEASEATDSLRLHTLLSAGILAIDRIARTGFGIVNARFNEGRVKGETATDGGDAVGFA